MNEQYQSPQPILPTSTLATISMIAGILGFVAFPVIGSIVAIWTGYEARKETRAVPPVAGGDGMASAGIVMGWIQIGLAVIGLCCFALYFVFIAGAVGISLNQ
ncbi:MAG: DUF4190 domain-containing protein [Anaerolineaceae bacterium]|jgi:hypothetical protein|nr:MAG: DUF4190 domain-containing protein [Anaerolineaceae bacterium]